MHLPFQVTGLRYVLKKVRLARQSAQERQSSINELYMQSNLKHRNIVQVCVLHISLWETSHTCVRRVTLYAHARAAMRLSRKSLHRSRFNAYAYAYATSCEL